jgi:acetoacetyl-CoA synthetase
MLARIARQRKLSKFIPNEQVTDIPHTKSGKLVELAVRHVVHGQAVSDVEVLANPQALDLIRDRAELRS